MKHLASRLSAAALLCCTLFPLFTQAQEPTYPQPVSEYAEETGPGTMAFLSYPKYYKNTQGHLVEVVTDLVPSVDPAWDYEVQTGIWHLKVKKDGTFQASHAGDTFTYRFNSLGLGRGSQFKKVDLGEPDFSQVSVIGDTIRWSEIYPDVDLAVRYLHDILKVDVVVKKEFLRDLKAEVKAGNLDKNDYLTARFDIPQVLIRSQAKQNGQDKDLYKEALDVDQPVYFEKEGKVVHKLRPVETYLLDEQGEPVLDPEQPIRSAQVWQLKHKEAGTAEMSALLEDPVVPSLQITQQEQGWSCIQTGDNSSYISLVSPHLVGEDTLLFTEVFVHPDTTMNFHLDWHRLHAVRVLDAQPMFSKFVYYQDHPFQIESMFSWGNRSILFGFYQIKGEKIGDIPVRHYLVSVLDELGNVIQEKPLPTHCHPLGVHQEKNLFFCLAYEGALATRLLSYSLPDLQPVEEKELEDRTHYVNYAYKGGDWLYVMIQEGNSPSATIAKRNLFTSEIAWTQDIQAASGYPLFLNVQKELLWYGVQESLPRMDGGALELDTGTPVLTSERYHPDRVIVESNGSYYKISLEKDPVSFAHKSFTVKPMPLQSCVLKNEWEKLD